MSDFNTYLQSLPWNLKQEQKKTSRKKYPVEVVVTPTTITATKTTPKGRTITYKDTRVPASQWLEYQANKGKAAVRKALREAAPFVLAAVAAPAAIASAPAVAAALAPGTVGGTIAADAAVGGIGAHLINKTHQAIDGRTWGEGVSDTFSLIPGTKYAPLWLKNLGNHAAEMTNPGYYSGGFARPLWNAAESTVSPVLTKTTSAITELTPMVLHNAKRSLIFDPKTRRLVTEIDKSVDKGLAPNFNNEGLLYRVTTPSEWEAIQSPGFDIIPTGMNHGVYGWRQGAPFYRPGSYVETKQLARKVNVPEGSKVLPTYITIPAEESLLVRPGAGGNYSDPIPSTQIHGGANPDYHPAGGLSLMSGVRTDNSSVAFKPGDVLPDFTKSEAWTKINGKWIYQPYSPAKTIEWHAPMISPKNNTLFKFFEKYSHLAANNTSSGTKLFTLPELLNLSKKSIKRTLMDAEYLESLQNLLGISRNEAKRLINTLLKNLKSLKLSRKPASAGVYASNTVATPITDLGQVAYGSNIFNILRNDPEFAGMSEQQIEASIDNQFGKNTYLILKNSKDGKFQLFRASKKLLQDSKFPRYMKRIRDAMKHEGGHSTEMNGEESSIIDNTLNKIWLHNKKYKVKTRNNDPYLEDASELRTRALKLRRLNLTSGRSYKDLLDDDALMNSDQDFLDLLNEYERSSLLDYLENFVYNDVKDNTLDNYLT